MEKIYCAQLACSPYSPRKVVIISALSRLIHSLHFSSGALFLAFPLGNGLPVLVPDHQNSCILLRFKLKKIAITTGLIDRYYSQELATKKGLPMPTPQETASPILKTQIPKESLENVYTPCADEIAFVKKHSRSPQNRGRLFKQNILPIALPSG